MAHLDLLKGVHDIDIESDWHYSRPIHPDVLDLNGERMVDKAKTIGAELESRDDSPDTDELSALFFAIIQQKDEVHTADQVIIARKDQQIRQLWRVIASLQIQLKYQALAHNGKHAIQQKDEVHRADQVIIARKDQQIRQLWRVIASLQNQLKYQALAHNGKHAISPEASTSPPHTAHCADDEDYISSSLSLPSYWQSTESEKEGNNDGNTQTTSHCACDTCIVD
eukprot:CAMPEP_0197075660 /NCGR_PEP_ID=MMETSP1384-20130603/211725_1 /TAXON_ID=29189 /ORGANISM="Ammonia sp." /LENGTH=224 /DNA_ID=CAMNT_0042514509 /DNA_START=87 /DNA_END=761 /DNA_ORIENTATION=-